MKPQVVPDATPPHIQTQVQTEHVSRFVAGLIFLGVLSSWVIFGWYAITDGSAITELWNSFRDLDLVVRIGLWIVFLPWVVAIWAWQSALPLLVRIAIATLMALMTIGIFEPNRANRG